MKENKKNIGIELLRVLSMFYVVILHTLGHGGVLKTSEQIGGGVYSIAWFIEICAYSSVDIFALISGYVGYKVQDKDISIKKLLRLYGMVWFYSLLGVLICAFFAPNGVTMNEVFRSCFPLINGGYWYFNAYAGAFLFFPLLNYALNNISEKILVKFLIILAFIFPTSEILSPQYKLMNGYSPIWLIILYIVGFSLNKLEINKKINIRYCIMFIFVIPILNCMWKLFGINYNMRACDICISKDMFVSYLSPLVLIVSISYLILFSQIQIQQSLLKKIVELCGKSSFAIYLLNDNWLIREKLIKNAFVNWCYDPVILLVIKVLLFSIIFVFGAIIFEIIRIYVRDLIFKLIKRIKY